VVKAKLWTIWEAVTNLAVLFSVSASSPCSVVLCPLMEIFSFWEGGGRQIALEDGVCCSGEKTNQGQSREQGESQITQGASGPACFSLLKCMMGPLEVTARLIGIGQIWGSSLPEAWARRAGDGVLQAQRSTLEVVLLGDDNRRHLVSIPL